MLSLCYLCNKVKDMDVIERLKWRYATKKFDATKYLSSQKVEVISMLVVSDKKIRADLVEHSYGQRQILDASHLLVICIQDNITSTDVDDLFNNIHDIRNTSNSILDPYREGLKKMMKKIEDRLKKPQ